jgi:geranylgeranyl pyrophosphate synthase
MITKEMISIENLARQAIANINTIDNSDDFVKMLQEAIFVEGSSRLPNLILLVAKAVNPGVDLANIIDFAIACHFFISASTIVDDIIDADRATSLFYRYGTARALFGGLGLWLVAEQKLLEVLTQRANSVAKENINTIVTLLDQLHAVFLQTCVAEFSDIEKLSLDKITEQQMLEQLNLKTGKTLEIMFKITAYLAGGTELTITKYTNLGSKLGTLTQIKNDLDSCYEQDPLRNSLCQRQPTLPVAYALSLGSPELVSELKRLWESKVETEGNLEVATQLSKLLESTGGIGSTLFSMHNISSQIASTLIEPSIYDKAILEATRQLLVIHPYLASSVQTLSCL